MKAREAQAMLMVCDQGGGPSKSWLVNDTEAETWRDTAELNKTRTRYDNTGSEGQTHQGCSPCEGIIVMRDR
jgi:hypothetical protein